MKHSERISISTGMEDFSELLLEGGIFVDKSLMVRYFLQDSGGVVSLIARPRRWGKSVNMSMLARFLAIEVDTEGNALPPEQCLNRKLFAGGEVELITGEKKQLKPLKIASYTQLMEYYQGQFPVISLNLKDIKNVTSYEAFERGIREAIQRLYTAHGYLERYTQPQESLVMFAQKEKLRRFFDGTSTHVDLADSLRFLSELLHKHFQRPVYVFVDEYDTPVHSAYLEFGKQDPKKLEQLLEFLRTMLGAVFKGNTHLKQGLITGILRIAKSNIFADFNNVLEYTIVDEPFASFYGFTEEEVIELMQQVPTKTSIDELRHWYNGYTFRGQDVGMYNPWSIMCCLANSGKLAHYWIDSGGMAILDEALLSDELQDDLQTLLAGERLEIPVDNKIHFKDLSNPSGLCSLLLFSGYLNLRLLDIAHYIYQLSIPNYEVQFIYERWVLDWALSQLDTDKGGYYSFVSLLTGGNVDAFRTRLEELLASSRRFPQLGLRRSSLFYSGLVLSFISMLSGRYYIESEWDSGLGGADVLLIPKPSHGDEALMLEYKVAKEASELDRMAQLGLAHVREKSSLAKVKDHVRSVLQVSLAFCGKEVVVVHERVELIGKAGGN